MAVCWLSARTCSLLPRFVEAGLQPGVVAPFRDQPKDEWLGIRFSFSRHSALATALHSRCPAMWLKACHPPPRS
jgi:hypothetical protein